MVLILCCASSVKIVICFCFFAQGDHNRLSYLQVGARLISHAGSLTNLAKYPASTVQILGAEKALFRYWGTPSLLGKKVAAVMAGLGWSRAG